MMTLSARDLFVSADKHPDPGLFMMCCDFCRNAHVRRAAQYYPGQGGDAFHLSTKDTQI